MRTYQSCAYFLSTLLVVFSAEILGVTLEEECITGLSVVAPELAVPGKTTAILVTLNGPTSIQQSFNVTLRLLDNSQIQQNTLDSYSQPLLEITREIKGQGILEFKVPADSSGSCHLQTFINCTTTVSVGDDDDKRGKIGNTAVGGDECELRSSSEMRLVGPVRDVIVRPARQAYGPGETLEFWILALNHDMQVATGAIGSVSIKDPQETKVAIWDQIALDEGVKSFSLPLSPYATIGRWTVQVEVDQSSQFFAYVEVTPSNNAGLPDVAVAEEHYVELRFSEDMRRRYKPGLPFSGKVQAMSTEKSVRVRVKVYDNTTSIYSQDIEISNGEGTFLVPAIMADSDEIALQAELVSVDSKEIESHYVLAREPIKKWNSSSDCFLLIQDVKPILKPEEMADFTILSTCPCTRDMHFVITTEERITDWAEKRHKDYQTIPEPNGSCKVKFNFTVKSIMAPVSQLLVYYITPQGEPVSDVTSFNVRLMEEKIHLNMEKRDWWLPDQYIDVELSTQPSSLVCLLGGSSLTSDAKFDPRISEHQPPQVTGEVDFLEAGVSFFQQQCARRGNSPISAISYRQRGSGAGPSRQKQSLSESLVGGTPHDQLWMWKCFNSSSELTKMSISAPKEAGKWSIWALSVSTAGLRFSPPIHLQVFKPLEAEFRLPPSLRVRETVEVDIKIANNLNSCVDVTALLALSEGAQFVNNGLLYVTERLRLGSHGATSLVVRILATTAGVKNLTVEINGYASSNCDGGEDLDNTTLSGAVVHSAAFRVLPEGIVRSSTESAYFCANENLVVSTSDTYKYEWIPAPRNYESIVTEVKSSQGPVYVALAESKTKLEKIYRITIGDAENTVCHIGRGKYNYGIQLASVNIPNVLSREGWSTYWISWDKDVIAFGNGSSISNNNTLLSWKMDKKFKIRYIGFASAWGSLAEFRIWNFNEEAGFSQVLHLDTPKKVVPGSEWGELQVTGGMAVPRVRDIEGGGLTEVLASLTPLLSIQKVHLSNGSDREELISLLPGRIQSILSFRKEDNSFSEHPMLGSHKATVSILEALSKVQHYFSVDPELIQAVKKWVQLRQEDDGRFTPLDADVDLPSLASTDTAWKNLSQEAIFMENVAEITAETVIALLEIGIETDTDSDTLQKAKVFLENSLPKIQMPQTLAAVTLALVLVRSATAAWAIEKLRNASTTDDGEFGWEHFIPKKDAADWLYESDSDRVIKEPLVATVEEYRASLYALSIFCLIGDIKTAESVARFLFYRSHILDNHSELLYPAVKAFTAYDGLAKDKHRSLIVSLATSGMELTDTLELNKNKASQTLYLPSLPTKIFVYATGAGCATIQGRITYSTYEAINNTPLLELGAEIVEEIRSGPISIEEIEGKMPRLKIKTCFVWKGNKPSAVLRLEIFLFSGFELTSSPPQLLNPPQEMAEIQHGNHDNKIWFTFANISTNCPICVQFTARSSFVITSFRPAYARVYPSGREDLAAETFFHAKSASTLLHDVNTDDLITWFGSNKTFTNIQISDYCKRNENNQFLENISTTQPPVKPEKFTLIGEAVENVSNNTQYDEDTETTTVTTNKETKLGDFKIQNISTVRFVNKLEPKITTPVPKTAEANEVITKIPTLLKVLKILKENKNLNRHFETVSLDSPNIDDNGGETNHSDDLIFYSTEGTTDIEMDELTTEMDVIKNETIDKATQNLQNAIPTWTTESSIVPFKTTVNTQTVEADKEKKNKNKIFDEEKIKSKVPEKSLIVPVLTNRHVNTEQIHEIPERMLLEEHTEKEKDDLQDIKNYEYVLVNKESLWSMLREAVDDEFKRKEMLNTMSNGDKSRS